LNRLLGALHVGHGSGSPPPLICNTCAGKNANEKKNAVYKATLSSYDEGWVDGLGAAIELISNGK